MWLRSAYRSVLPCGRKTPLPLPNPNPNRIFRRFNSSRSPLEEYAYRCSQGLLRHDPYQEGIISSLNSLYSQLKAYRPPTIEIPTPESLKPKSGLTAFLSRFKPRSTPQTPPETVPKGIYLYGDVGCGKTMLMDLFYDTVPEHLSKRRVHFHAFMQDVHKRNHQLHSSHGKDLDAIPIIAATIATEANVLCFDEFQVTDVADAMILRRLLNILLSPTHGVVLFITSNREPDALYINGIQRDSFIPCIKQLQSRNHVVYLDSPTDYRKVPKPLLGVYFHPENYKNGQTLAEVAEAEETHVRSWFEYFGHRHRGEEIELSVWGRPVRVPRGVVGAVAEFEFNQLCGQPLSSGDYLQLTQTFPAFIVRKIPFLSEDDRDKIRRFITFIDALYDNHGKLVVTAAAPFSELFVEKPKLPGEIAEEEERAEAGMGAEAEDPLVAEHGFDAEIAKKAKMFTVDEEKFAFARALSRLHQMSTSEWVNYKA